MAKVMEYSYISDINQGKSIHAKVVCVCKGVCVYVGMTKIYEGINDVDANIDTVTHAQCVIKVLEFNIYHL